MSERCATAPCKSCPYRRDVPSGVWHESEYEKLPAYDGELIDQITNGGTGLFMCHQRDGHLCAGWVGCHGAENLFALRLPIYNIDPSVWSYASPVPLFASGVEAYVHGMKDIDDPGPAANRVMNRLLAKAGREQDEASRKDRVPTRSQVRGRQSHHDGGPRRQWR